MIQYILSIVDKFMNCLLIPRLLLHGEMYSEEVVLTSLQCTHTHTEKQLVSIGYKLFVNNCRQKDNVVWTDTDKDYTNMEVYQTVIWKSPCVFDQTLMLSMTTSSIKIAVGFPIPSIKIAAITIVCMHCEADSNWFNLYPSNLVVHFFSDSDLFINGWKLQFVGNYDSLVQRHGW